MKEEVLKQRVQQKILLLSFLILVGKFIAYWLTASVGILTDALESIVNVAAGAMSLYALYWSARPKDKSHPFGHGKVELLSASVEGIMISMAGLMIIYEGIKRLFFPVEVQRLDVGIIIVAVSGLLNYVMGWYSIRTGKRYSSVALVAGGKHLQSDTYSTIGLVVGLLLLYFTHIAWIDSALALLFGGIIIATGISILRKTTANLLDKADEELLRQLAETLNEKRGPEWIDIHNTKVIKYGNFLYMDCDLTVPWYYTIEEGHKVGDRLKAVLESRFADRIQLTIHLDPCNIFDRSRCDCCPLECKYRKEAFKQLETIGFDSFVRLEKED